MALLSPSKITTMDHARKHRRWALFILVVVYVFNFIDRQIVNILQEDIKKDLNLLDWQLGTMTGLSFALVYCVAGIPVARIADSTSRKGVVTISLAIWSGFTALCGLATNYITLLGARMGVGLGEAGGSPPAHAMISDLYEKEKRGRALAIYSAGLYAGTLLGYYLGGWLSDALSWRQAFFVVGIPGVIFAIITWTTMREPIRGLSGLKPSTAKVTFFESFKKLWALKSFRYYSLATGAGTFVTYGLGNWMPSFLPRTYGEWSMPELQGAIGLCSSEVINGVRQLGADCTAMSRTEIGLFYGTVSGVGGMIGTIWGGYLADKMGAKDRRWFLWVPMWGKFVGAPLFIGALLAPTAELSLLLYFPAITLAAMYLGPSLAITHHLVPASMRAMSSAVLFFILNILGLGTGPVIVGAVSDIFNDAGACAVASQAVQALQACPSFKDVAAAMASQGLVPAGTTLTVDAINQAVASGALDLRPLVEAKGNFFGGLLGQIGTGIAVLLGLALAALLFMRKLSQAAGIILIVLVVLAWLIFAATMGAFDFTFKQWAFSLRSAFPEIGNLGINQDSLRWGMVLAVGAMFPLAILWHLGARTLPTGQLDDEGNAVGEALTEGDPQGAAQTTGPKA